MTYSECINVLTQFLFTRAFLKLVVTISMLQNLMVQTLEKI